MTYNEWRDELKSNLLCVSDNERRRVLDYYAEAYADRREAGFSEREIIDDFGAPYDAAQRILYEKVDDEPTAQATPTAMPATTPMPMPATPSPSPAPELTRREKKQAEREARRQAQAEQQAANTPPPPPPQPVQQNTNATWVFVLLCIIFCVPLFGLIMGMVGITIGFCVAPIAIIGSGAAAIGGSIGSMIGGDVTYGLYLLGSGLITFGVGVVLCPIFFKLVKLMWKLFRTVFTAVKNAFSGKERTV